MTIPRFVQLHSLVSYPAVLLNRDDAGLAKRLTYGGAVRTRVSSQCLKRHWRMVDDDWDLAHLATDRSVRSREIFERAIRQKVQERMPSLDAGVLDAAGLALTRALYGKKADETAGSRQALLFGWREVDYLSDQVATAVRDAAGAAAAVQAIEELFKERNNKANLSAIRDTAGPLASGVEAALFGRMVTSDPAANTDAAIHVAHAFTVHEQETETDYFTVVDDLKAQDDAEDAGSAGIFDTELTSGLFYGYVVVDVPLLVANVTGVEPENWATAATDRELPARILEHLTHLIATVSPGAKKGSTAPYAWAQTMVAEVGTRQPRSLATAFELPVRRGARESVSALAEDAMFERLAQFDRAYGRKEERRFLSLTAGNREEAVGPVGLDDLAGWLKDVVTTASA